MKMFDAFRKMLGRVRIARLDNKLNLALERANRLHVKRRDTVVCVYCGGLLLNRNAGVVYDIAKGALEYHHEECFQKYEKHGTYEDLCNAFISEKEAANG